MKSLKIDKFGGPDVMQLVEVPTPEPKPGEALIKIEAAGLNYSDIMIREGLYIDAMSPPLFLGREFAGTVEKIGDGVANVKPGQRVAGTAPAGAFSEYLSIHTAGLFPLPNGLSPEQGAAILIQGITAVHCLDDCTNLKSGETVLIHAAAGGVGTLAIQIALAREARVLGTASSADKCKLITELGAKAIDYTQDDWVKHVLDATGGKGADVILESVGGDIFTRSYKEALATFGRMVVYGVAGGNIVNVNNREILESNKSLIGYYLGSYIPKHMDRVAAASMKLVQLIMQGKVKPIIGQTFPLDKAVDAFNFMQSRKSVGKVIIKP